MLQLVGNKLVYVFQLHVRRTKLNLVFVFNLYDTNDAFKQNNSLHNKINTDDTTLFIYIHSVTRKKYIFV